MIVVCNVVIKEYDRKILKFGNRDLPFKYLYPNRRRVGMYPKSQESEGDISRWYLLNFHVINFSPSFTAMCKLI